MRLEDPMDLERAWARRRVLSRAAIGGTALLLVVIVGLWLAWPDGDGATAGDLLAEDARRVWWISPQLAWGEQLDAARVFAPRGAALAIGDVPEPGLAGAGGLDWAVVRGADPLAPARAAFRLRIRGDWSSCAGVPALRCADIAPDPAPEGPGPLQVGVPYWIAVALKFDPDLLADGKDPDDVESVLELDRSDAADPTPAPFAIETGAAPEPFVRIVVRHRNGIGSGNAVVAERRIWREVRPETAQWQYFVLHLRLHWDPEQQPFIRIWRAIGDGRLVRIADDDAPNWFEDSPDGAWQRLGVVRRSPLPADQTRTLFTKGIYVFRDAHGGPPMDAPTLLGLLRRF